MDFVCSFISNDSESNLPPLVTTYFLAAPEQNDLLIFNVGEREKSIIERVVGEILSLLRDKNYSGFKHKNDTNHNWYSGIFVEHIYKKRIESAGFKPNKFEIMNIYTANKENPHDRLRVYAFVTDEQKSKSATWLFELEKDKDGRLKLEKFYNDQGLDVGLGF